MPVCTWMDPGGAARRCEHGSISLRPARLLPSRASTCVSVSIVSVSLLFRCQLFLLSIDFCFQIVHVVQIVAACVVVAFVVVVVVIGVVVCFRYVLRDAAHIRCL